MTLQIISLEKSTSYNYFLTQFVTANDNSNTKKEVNFLEKSEK